MWRWYRGLKRWERLFLLDELLWYFGIATLVLWWLSPLGFSWVLLLTIGVILWLPRQLTARKTWVAFNVEYPDATVPWWFREGGLWPIEHSDMYLRAIVYRRAAGWAWKHLYGD
jgi:hypothetical protein